MTKKQPHASNKNANATHGSKTTMTTKKTATVTSHASTHETTPAASQTSGSSVDYVQQPPKDAKIPAPPAGFVPTPGNDNRGLVPKKAHMAAIPDALGELARFADYDKIFGMTAPPLEYTKQTLGAAGNWSLQRAQLRSWDLYCRTQEGMAWRAARKLIDRMGPAFSLATTTDSTVAQRYPGFARLFGASKQIGQKAALTRQANKKLKAEGKEPTKGAAAQRKKQQTERALLAAAQAAQAAAATSTPASPPASGPPLASAPAANTAPMAAVSLVTPVSLVVPTAPVAQAAPAAPASAPVANGVGGAAGGNVAPVVSAQVAATPAVTTGASSTGH